MNVVICGSRNFKDYQKFTQEIHYILHKILADNIVDTKDDITIISGGADGADTLAKHYWNEFGYNNKELLADWKQYGKKAGILRNLQMLEIADLVIAFWDGSSRGTKHMLDQCKKRSIPIILIGV